MGATVSSSLRELGLEEMKMEQWKTLQAIGLDSREVLLLSSTPDAKVVDCTSDSTWIRMTSKQKQCFETLIKTLHLLAPNIRHTLDNFYNFSLMYLTMKTCQTSFFWPWFGIFLLF